MPTNLTARTVANLRPGAQPYYVVDTTKLALRVAPDGSKTWSVRYRIGRAQRRLTLGSLSVLTLADARQRAKDALKLVADGVDPAQVKQDRRDADTVADFADTYIKRAKAPDSDGRPKKKSWKTDEARIAKDVLPHWKHRLMRDITRRDVRELLDGIVARGAPISANRTRALLHKMFNVAIKLEVVVANPVTGTEKPGTEHQRDRVLTHDEIRTFWTACDAQPPEMGGAFKLRLVTAQRGGEVFGMRWRDVDLEGGWWTVPASGSKNGLAHRVPLSTTALDILKDVRTKTDERLKKQKDAKPPVFVFAGGRGKRQQAEATATFNIVDFHGHDLRRTAASCMASSGVPRLVISKILNHVERGVTAVYDRHSYDNEKGIALDQWARTLTAILEDKKDANVLPFARS